MRASFSRPLSSWRRVLNRAIFSPLGSVIGQWSYVNHDDKGACGLDIFILWSAIDGWRVTRTKRDQTNSVASSEEHAHLCY